MIPDEIALPGDIRAASLVAGRRGSQVWRLSMSDGSDMALKYTTDDDGDAVQQQAPLLAGREAAGPTRCRVSLRERRHVGGTWVAVTWCDADPLGKPWRRVRRAGTPANRTVALASTVHAAQAVADLHERGWRHGDLQADHILTGDAGPARLVDLALAQGPAPVAPDVTYRGALAHLTAPEVATEILTTPTTHHVSLTAVAEVYTFGAVLFAGWAGVWPHDYCTDDARSLTVAQIHMSISDPGSLRPMPDGWPALADLLAIMLDPAPADRPTMAEVASASRGLTGEGL